MEQYRLTPASSYDIREWSSGEVTRAEILEKHTHKPLSRGVCCESIFGQEDEWACKCGRLHGTADIGYICVRCDEPVIHSRSTRWGHIELSSPVVNPLFISTLAAVLDYTPTAMRQISRLIAWAVIEPGLSRYEVGDLFHDDEAHNVARENHETGFVLASGAEAIRALLSRLDLVALRARLSMVPSQRRRFRIIDRICRAAPADPNGHVRRMLLDCIPVLPPAQRLVRGQGGDDYGESLSTMYVRIVERNNRLRKLLELSAPEVIVYNEKRMLQQCVDIHFENAQRWKPEGWASNHSKVKSLADRLRGPTRDRLLSRRVDYSASGVLVPDAGVPSDAVAIPTSIALELFRTHILIRLGASELIELLHPRARGGLDESHLAARRLYREMLEDLGNGLVPLVEEILNVHRLVLCVHTDRPAPMVALRPVLGQQAVLAIHGTTLARLDATPGMRARLHLPLSSKAQDEARTLLGIDRLVSKPIPEATSEASTPRSNLANWFRSAQAARRERWASRATAEQRRVETRRAKYGAGLFAEILLGDPLPMIAKYAATGRAEPADNFLARWMRGAIVAQEEE